MPYGVTLLKVVSQQDKHSAEETRYYLSSAPAERFPPQRWLARIRGHWKCESQHWRKDATLGEDRTRTRNPNIMSNTIMLRNLVLHYYHTYGESQAEWLPIWVEQHQANIGSAFTLVTENTA